MSKPKIQNVIGMPDILPKDRRFYDMAEKACEKISSYYGYQRVETPILEFSELFEKSTGASSDVVQKQMYSLASEGGDRLTLRPEFTPSLVRAYIQHGMSSWTQPVKLSEFGPVFRHERPQSGRFREFRQFELDVFGDEDPAIDVQIISLFFRILNALGIHDVTILVNSIGCSKCKPSYRKVLREYYRGRDRSLCKDCRERKKINIFRLLDCKDEKCERMKLGAPEIVDHLCDACHTHLKSVLEMLDFLELPYALTPHLVRGLDYYTKTVFEIFPLVSLEDAAKESHDKETASREASAQVRKIDEKEQVRPEGVKEERVVALASGGRFDDLIEFLGGEQTPAVGGAMGIERVIAKMKELHVKVPQEKLPRVFFVHLGDFAKKKGAKLMEEFRLANIPVREALGRSSIRSQMGLADTLGVDFAVILGHQEVAEDTVILRDMKGGSQEVIPNAKIIKELKRRLASR
ncbi:MAG: histidine--tRNA ligase [Candidatus Spechtbacteria bacterium]|nr:histidine--tRNA ligase [Candidatus Spechtbacteria bacterium]